MMKRSLLLSALLLATVLSLFWYVEWTPVPEPEAVADVVSEEVAIDTTVAVSDNDPQVIPTEVQVIEQFFAPLTPLTIGDTALLVSVAKTPAERARGLSGSPYLPTGIGKFFVFDGPGRWGIWMKEMQYAIDIIWFDAAGQIVHIEEQVSPDTYPQVFIPTVDTHYVLEVPAGYVAREVLVAGDQADLSTILQ